MNNDKVSQLVDHQVFQQLQTANTDHPIGKGTILFANSFTGTKVEMAQKVRDALTSESLFIGNNPLVQLQKALERLEKGPWYIDCRGDVLYIHNKPYSTPSVHNYVYAHENGEVLSIGFKTQYRTKNATRGATMSFDNFKKKIKTTSTGISVGSEQDIRDRAKAMSGAQLNASANPNYLSPDIESERGYWETHWRGNIPSESPQKIQAEADNDFKRSAREDYEYMKEEAPEVHTNLVQSLLSNKNMGKGSQGEKEFQQRFKEAGDDPSKVQALFQEYFGQDLVTVDNGVYRPMVETKTLSELIGGGRGSSVYIPAYGTDGRKKGTSYVFQWGSASPIKGGDFAYSVEQFLKSKGYVLVSKPTYRNGNVVSGSRHGNVQVQIVHKVRSKYKISAVKLMTDYYSRYLDSPERSYMKYLINNAMNNSTRKITEKRLEISMRVVGRPTLTASAKVHIENIGSRSGDYHITRVIHKISSDGYTCSLTLSPGDYKTASTTHTLEAGVGSSKKTKRAKDGGEETKPTNGGVTIDLSMLTRDEMEYFATKAYKIKEQTNIATEIAYNLYLRSNNKPGASKTGVYHKHVDMDGDQVSKVWYSYTPPTHGSDYEDFKTVYSSKFYDSIRKKTEDYIRFKKR